MPLNRRLVPWWPDFPSASVPAVACSPVVGRWPDGQAPHGDTGASAVRRLAIRPAQLCSSVKVCFKAGNKQDVRPTLFDEVVEIIRHDGVGGEESEDGVVLELM